MTNRPGGLWPTDVHNIAWKQSAELRKEKIVNVNKEDGDLCKDSGA